MHSIDHLPASEREHYVKCSCGLYFDMRDLEAVFKHLHERGLPHPSWSAVQIKNEARVYTRNGDSWFLN